MHIKVLSRNDSYVKNATSTDVPTCKLCRASLGFTQMRSVFQDGWIEIRAQ